MILDASGRRMRRKIGFEGGMIEDREPTGPVQIHAVGFEQPGSPDPVEEARGGELLPRITK